jgi:hypothetical protein
MKLNLKWLGVAIFGVSGVAMAGGSRAPFDCHVEDQDGHTLAATSRSFTSEGDSHTLTASSEIFSFTMRLVGAQAEGELIDERSGDKVLLFEGDFDSGERVAVALVTDEAPESSLKLVCVAE